MTRSATGAMLEASAAVGGRLETVVWAGHATASDLRTGLVRRAQDGDSTAFERLAAERIDGAYRLALAILRSEEDARDAVQDAFVAAWRELRRLRDPSRFDAWLDRILVNACRMAIRHRRTVRIHEIPVLNDPASGWRDAGPSELPNVDEAAADADVVRTALRRLATDQRAILVLHHVEDRPVEDIAAVLGIPAGTVKWRLHAAREALRRAVEEELR